MPVQPQYSIGPLAQPAPPDDNQVPTQDGNARYVRSTPPGLFVAESLGDSSQRAADITLLHSPHNPMHRGPANPAGAGVFSNRRLPDGFSFGELGNAPLASRQEPHQGPASLASDATHHGRALQETPIKYSTPYGQNSGDALASYSRNEFHVMKEDFPALPRIPEFPEESVQEEPASQQLASPQTKPETMGDVLGRDKHDLKSFMERWSSKEFCDAYRLLNFEDLIRRSIRMHPKGECDSEDATRPHPLNGLVIGVLTANQCTQMHEPEDLRTEDTSYRVVNGHRVSVPLNDKYYAMSDDSKDKLRNPRLQMMDDFTLFFQFYFFVRDIQQLMAADALFQRNWRWNRKISRWCRFERAAHQASSNQQIGVFQLYDPGLCKIQSTILQYTPQDFELCPPAIPSPSLSLLRMNCAGKV